MARYLAIVAVVVDSLFYFLSLLLVLLLIYWYCITDVFGLPYRVRICDSSDEGYHSCSFTCEWKEKQTYFSKEVRIWKCRSGKRKRLHINDMAVIRGNWRTGKLNREVDLTFTDFEKVQRSGVVLGIVFAKTRLLQILSKPNRLAGFSSMLLPSQREMMFTIHFLLARNGLNKKNILEVEIRELCQTSAFQEEEGRNIWRRVMQYANSVAC